MRRPWRQRIRFSTKGLLAATPVAALILGILYFPRKYVARVTMIYDGMPITAAQVHPRFSEYKARNLSDDELVRVEMDWMLSPEIIAAAVQRFADKGGDPTLLGDDPRQWYRDRLQYKIGGDGPKYVEATLAQRQSYFVGRENFGRNTVAWRALLSLMEAYQSDAYSSPTFDNKGDRNRLPTFNFSYVDRRLF